MNAQMEEKIYNAANVLIKAGAREVFIFGSMTTNKDHDGSDIDFAVTGLPPDRFFKAMGLARRILKCDIDLIDLDEASPLTEYLKKHGDLRRVA